MEDLALTAAIVCRETFVRESVAESLAAGGFRIAASLRYLDPQAMASFDSAVDIVIYIDSSSSSRSSERDAESLSKLGPTNWLVMCDDINNAILCALQTLGLPASALPLDISRNDLVYLAGLAARGRRILLDEFCQAGEPNGIRTLQTMGLEPDQWQLLRCLSEGLANKEIGALLGTSEAIVKIQLRTLLNRLSVKNRTQAAVIAAKAGLKLHPESSGRTRELVGANEGFGLKSVA